MKLTIKQIRILFMVIGLSLIIADCFIVNHNSYQKISIAQMECTEKSENHEDCHNSDVGDDVFFSIINIKTSASFKNIDFYPISKNQIQNNYCIFIWQPPKFI